MKNICTYHQHRVLFLVWRRSSYAVSNHISMKHAAAAVQEYFEVRLITLVA